MAPIQVDPARTREFSDAASFAKWLEQHHDSADEVWGRIFKVGSGLPSITPKEAIDICLCWGWIDAVRKRLDQTSYLLRYTPRGRNSIWSKVNVGNVERLIAEGRMTPHGMAHVEAAKADGRWDRAYGGSKDLVLPAELIAAIEAEPAAKGDARQAQRPEPLRACLSHSQSQDRSRAQKEDRRVRRHACPWRNDLPAASELLRRSRWLSCHDIPM